MSTLIGDRVVDVHVNHVDPAFFHVMSIPLLRGRGLLRVSYGRSSSATRWRACNGLATNQWGSLSTDRPSSVSRATHISCRPRTPMQWRCTVLPGSTRCRRS